MGDGESLDLTQLLLQKGTLLRAGSPVFCSRSCQSWSAVEFWANQWSHSLLRGLSWGTSDTCVSGNDYGRQLVQYEDMDLKGLQSSPTLKKLYYLRQSLMYKMGITSLPHLSQMGSLKTESNRNYKMPAIKQAISKWLLLKGTIIPYKRWNSNYTGVTGDKNSKVYQLSIPPCL